VPLAFPKRQFWEASVDPHQVNGVHQLCGISDLDGQLLAERSERDFDLIEPGVVREIE
jgi:hypothetical protein